MLHTETVEGTTFELLKTLMHDKELPLFNLVGGTALALYMGHRLSVDLDLFTPQSFDAEKLGRYLTNKYNFKESFREKNTLKGEIKEVKIDCITYNYSHVESITREEGIRMYSMKDIAAMKLSAIVGNGTRLKDFVDIACLSTKLSFSDMIEAYQDKYPGANPVSVIKALNYHADINLHESIQIINGNYKWDKIEKRLNRMVKNNKTVFSDLPVEPVKKSG